MGLIKSSAVVIVTAALILLLLANLIQLEATTQYAVIYILEDGSIAVLPPDASPKIERISDNVYTLTGDIYGRIVVQRDNIVIEGAGFRLYGSTLGTWAYTGVGINITGRANITIRNLAISFYEAAIYVEGSANVYAEYISVGNAYSGIYALSSSNITVWGSEFSYIDDRAVCIEDSNNASVIGNSFTDVFRAVHVYNSTYVSITGNEVRGWNKTYYGIYLYRTRYSNIASNIVEGRYGIYVFLSDNNMIYNNFFNNSVWNFAVVSGRNSWSVDPSEGRNILGGDKIGGNAYILAGGDGYSQTCPDENNDGFCDLPLSLDGTDKNVDLYPLKFAGEVVPVPTRTVTETITLTTTKLTTLISERTVTHRDTSTLTLTLTLRESVGVTETVTHFTEIPPSSVVITETAILERKVTDIVPSLISSIITILTLTWIAAFFLKKTAPKAAE